jgi:predicted kinase
MGTGKSTLARALHRELGWTLLSSDSTRKRLADLDPARPQAEAFGQGVYSAAWTARTYDALLDEAGEALATGRSVLLDASFLRRSDRQAAAGLAAAHGARLLFVECACPREMALQRLAKRWKSRNEGGWEPGETASRASDGRPDLYDAQQSAWEPFDPGAESDTEHIEAATALPLAANVVQVLEALRVPHFVCWLCERVDERARTAHVSLHVSVSLL